MRAWTMVWLLATGGCFADLGGGTSNTTPGSSSTDTTSAGTTTLPTTGPQTDTGSADDTTTDAASSGGSESTGSPEGQACDPFVQDCPDGFKCAPYASDGGDSWDANKCVPVLGDDQPGQGCTAEGSPTTGYDSCEKGSLCSQVGPNLTGVCSSLCGGTAQSPSCTPGLACLSVNDGAINLCTPTCNPKNVTPCTVEGQACIDNEGQFFCIDSNGFGLGSKCEYLNDCAAGLFCGPSDAPYCDAAGGCCLQYCEADADCPMNVPCTLFDPPYEGQYAGLGYCGENL